MMTRRYIIALFLTAGVASSAPLAAQQNLSSTVSITNDYESRAGEVSRYELAFAIPDSLMRFDYKFDYSVFDKPYRGAFEFSPYAVRLAPESSPASDGRLFVRAGAGYNFHPELQAAWRAVNTDNYSLSVYQDLHGYVGNYRTVRNKVNQQLPLATTRGVRNFGYDLSENFGALSRWRVKKAEFGLDLGYRGIFTEDEVRTLSYNALGVKFSSRTADMAEVKIVHDVCLSADFSADRIPHPFEGTVNYPEHNFALSGYAGSTPVFGGLWSFGADFDMRFSRRRSDVGSAGYAKITPKALFAWKWFRASGGIGLSGFSKFAISPEIDFRATFLKNRFCAYGGLTGGLKSNTYSSLKSANHWFFAGYAADILDTHEKLKAFAGLKGSAFDRFFFDVNVGWASRSNEAFWGVRLTGDELTPALVYADDRQAFANLELGWKSEHVEAAGELHWTKVYDFDPCGALLPPSLFGAAHATYNYRKRIYAGLDFEASTARNCSVPGYQLAFQPWMDLGLHAEFVFSGKLSFWLRGRNLLCESIQKLPMHIENGPEVTAGVIFHL